MSDDYLVQSMDKIGELFASARNVVVLTHVGPDGDALGSMTAVGQVMKRLGKELTMVIDDKLPERFSYLPLFDEVRDSVPQDVDFDLLIAVDCGDEMRMGDAYGAVSSRPFVVNIDHHITNNNFGRVNLVPSSVASTCEVLYALLTHLGYTIDEPLAISLLTGIVTDTLCFRTANTSPQTLQIASALIEAGAELTPIVSRALIVKPYNTIKRWREGLSNMKLEAGVAWSAISRNARTKAGYDGGNSAGLASMLSDIEEAACAAVLIELDDGRISLSLRSRPPFDVSVVAVELGGVGHALESGAALDMPLEEATNEVVSRLKAAVLAQRAQTENAP